MNRLRPQKFKLNKSSDTSPSSKPNLNIELTTMADINTMNSMAANKENLNNSPSTLPLATETQSNSLLNKLTKSYSTLSHKIKRRTNSARKSQSPQRPISGSYNMTGANSEDHRPEIGAPILISTTTLDADRLDVSEARLRQIGGGIAVTSTLQRNTPATGVTPAQVQSSSSETEEFVDARSNTPIVNSTQDASNQEEEQFVLALAEPLKNVDTPPQHQSSPHSNSSSHSTAHKQLISIPISPIASYTPATKTTTTETRPKALKRQHSKSATNLHRAELKVFLQKTPSMDLNSQIDSTLSTECEKSLELPKLPELFGDASTDGHEADRENSNSSPSETNTRKLQCKSEPNTPMCPEQKVTGFLAQQQHFKSIDSLNIQRNAKLRSINFNSSNSINQQSSNSLNSHNSTIADFDLKSVSCQSLNAQSLFVSIDELNDLTRQINESEEFNKEIDLEYCLHRDNLKPSERRITLLKNKNTALINFTHNKEKIKRGWFGVKHWIGEESTKLKEAVHKQAKLQRVGSSKLNLNLSNGECRNSPSVHGSVMLRKEGNVNIASTLTLDQSVAGGAGAAVTGVDERAGAEVVGLSCDTLAETENELEDLESSFTQPKEPGQNGFEELRRYVKQGGDFGKELILIMQERVDSEMLYSKSLSKMANKLNKACRELPGSIADAWRAVATEMESRSDVHRQLSASLTDEIVKPLKAIVDGHHKTRKSVESNVDKSARVLADWRISEAKAKKASHTAARENEKLQDAMLDVRIQKSPSIALLHQGPNKMAAEREIKSAEKDCAKLDHKRKKAEEAVKRADVEYYTLCLRAERARVDWEMSVLRGSSLLQTIENQRLVNMKNFVAHYTRLTENMNPILDGVLQRLLPHVEACNVVKDMQVVKNIRRNSEGPSEQLLPDFYCEHTTLAMNRERRKHALIKLLQLVKTDLERERRTRNGLKGLAQSLNSQEHQNITDKLYHIRSMLTYLEGARFKLHSALLELDHKPRTTHPLAQHIQITRDRTGLQQSILKVPLWLKNNDKITTSQEAENSSFIEHEYDCIAPGNATNNSNNNTSQTNINGSCIDLSPEIARSFNRSKSNIETFSTTTRITLSNAEKNKTISSNLESPYFDRGQADGGSNQQDSDFDEFSSQDDDDEQSHTNSSHRKEHKANMEKNTTTNCTDNLYQNSAELHESKLQINGDKVDIAENCSSSGAPHTTVILSRCKALYSYTPKLYDELELNPGDIIEVHAKQEDGWWLGRLGDQIGIFPATYVEEFA